MSGNETMAMEKSVEIITLIIISFYYAGTKNKIRAKLILPV